MSPAQADPAVSRPFPYDIVIIGGCGRVGLPLGIAFADRGLSVVLSDIDESRVDLVNRGRLPFAEPGAAEKLEQSIASRRLLASTDNAVVGQAEHVVVVIGTPVDEHLNPDPNSIPETLGRCGDHLVDGQILVLRSTVYPGVTALVERMMSERDLDIDVAFCPERLAEGKAMTELFSLPQIVAGRTPQARKRAEELFRSLTDQIVHLEPEEAELAKLFTNTWRYIKFAIANQLYMIANDFGVDYARVRDAIVYEYPRAADLPGAGLAAGPCLLKDTMQLAAFNDNNFALGMAAMQVNEGLPLYLVSRLSRRFDLATLTVGILGMAFKAESDDARSSLSYKLKRILQFKAKEVVTTDPYVTTDADLLPLDDVLRRSDLLIVGAPHPEYGGLDTDVTVVDIWNLLGQGVSV